MTIRVAITGYGRIGRNVLRAFYEERTASSTATFTGTTVIWS